MANKSVLDKIIEWYMAGRPANHENYGLTPAQVEAFERWDFIDNLLRQHTPHHTTKFIMDMWSEKFGLSDRQFWNDLKKCQEMFGSLRSRDKEYHRSSRSAWLERIAFKAEMDGDYDAAVKALKEANEIDGLRKDPAENAGPTQPHTYQQPVMIVHADGSMTNTTFMLDDLKKLPKAELEKILSMASAQYPGIEEMSKLIEESIPTDDQGD